MFPKYGIATRIFSWGVGPVLIAPGIRNDTGMRKRQIDLSACPGRLCRLCDQLTTSVTVVLCTKGLELPVMVIVYVPGCVPEVPFALLVFMVNAEPAEPLPGVKPEGENEQLDCAGRPEQDSESLWLNEPPSSLTVTV